VANFLRVRIEAFALLLLVALFTVLDQLTTSFRMLDPGTWRAALMEQMPAAVHPFFPVSAALDLTLSLVASCFLAFILLRMLPSRPVPLRPLIAGALLIGVSLTGLNIALGRSLISLGARFQAYGIIGGFLVLTLWVLVVGVVLYYGVAVSVVVNEPLAGGRSAPQRAGQSLGQGPG
jgi:membrane protein